MNPLQRLVVFLDEIVQQEQSTSRDGLTSRIVGELLSNYDGVYEKLRNDNPKVERIADLASDMEWSNGSEEQLDAMWQELKTLAKELSNTGD